MESGRVRAKSIGARREAIGGAVVIAAAAVLALWPRKALWLDEAQSVAIARAGWQGIVDGLRADGAPPLYYVALHSWMNIFGDGDRSVRSLSALFAIAGMLVLSIGAARVANRRTAWVVLVITAVNPYFIRYASETRMYALVLLEVAVGIVAVELYLRTGGRTGLIGIFVASTALMYTHYWGLYAVAATACCLLFAAVRSRTSADRRRAMQSLGAIAASVAAFLPWVTVLRFQSRHTGTPWTTPSTLIEALNITLHRATGTSRAAITLSYLLAAALLVGVVLAWRPAARTSRAAGPLRVTVSALCLALVVMFAFTFFGSHASNSGFVARYAMVMFPLIMIVAGSAIARVRRITPMLGAVVAIVGLVVTVDQVDDARTRAPMFEQALVGDAQPGDVVVFCPDQLGPPIDRLLERGEVAQLTRWVFPTMRAPDRVDWIDYRDRHQPAAAAGFARRAVEAAGVEGSVWLVISTTYPPTQAACSALQSSLSDLRDGGTTVIADDPDWSDHDALWRFAPGDLAASAALTSRPD